MVWTKRTVVASLAVGVLGAAIGIAIISLYMAMTSVGYFMIIVAGIVSFLVCSFLSICYLTGMENQSWKQGFGLGITLGTLAGVISGFITGIILVFCEGANDEFSNFIICALFGVLFSIIPAIVASSLLTLIIGPIFLKFLTRHD